MDPWLESARPSAAQPHWPSPVGKQAAWWRAGWMAPQTHRWCSRSSPGSSPFVSQWWCGIPAFLWLPADKIYQHLWTLRSSENLILNHQQTFSTTCLGTPGKSTVFWAVHIREGIWPRQILCLLLTVPEGTFNLHPVHPVCLWKIYYAFGLLGTGYSDGRGR